VLKLEAIFQSLDIDIRAYMKVKAKNLKKRSYLKIKTGDLAEKYMEFTMEQTAYKAFFIDGLRKFYKRNTRLSIKVVFLFVKKYNFILRVLFNQRY